MLRHQSRPTRRFRALALFGAAVVLGAALPRPAPAQNINVFVNTAFVATNLLQNGVGGANFFCGTAGGTPIQFICPVAQEPSFLTGLPVPFPQTYGDISNDPEINFENNYDANPAYPNRCNVTSLGTPPNGPTLAFPFGNPPNGNLLPGVTGFNICNSEVFLCAQACAVGASTSAPVAIDELEFEVFRYVDGANPLDSGSTPPLRTFFVNAPGVVSGPPPNDCVPGGSGATSPFVAGPATGAGAANCVLWDGSQAVQGTFGKINGSYGFRVTVQTNEQGQSGNIAITQVTAYPMGATKDGNINSVEQQPIKINVTDVHVINSTPTVVGRITGVAAEPYNFTFRLSKPATMYITINSGVPDGTGNFANIRNVLGANGEQEPYEGNLGTPGASPLLDGASWDGRDNSAQILPPGSYLAVFQANSFNQYTAAPYGGVMGGDLSNPTTFTISLDPLQLTDIQVSPLLGGATSLAVLSYTLTESATVYVDIYPPGTQFCTDSAGNPALADLNGSDGAAPNSSATDPINNGGAAVIPPAKWFQANFTCGAAGTNTTLLPLRSITQFQNLRAPVIAFWDGRDSNGNYMNDGDYVFVMYASLPSQRGYPYNGNANDTRVWTSVAKTGFISVVRGLVGITQITPTSTVIGSSPPVAGLNPFTFSYQISRPAVVTLKVFDQTGINLVKTLVNGETQAGQTTITEVWTDGTNDAGLVVSSGTYLAQLTVYDPVFPAKVSTTTVLFPVNMFRITDVGVTPLLSVVGDTATLTYQLSQPMFIAWNVYPPGSVVVDSSMTWPPCSGQNPPNACTSAAVVSPGGAPVPPVITFYGMRPGRLKITETWDGRSPGGIFVPDGQYVFTLSAISTTTPQYFPSDHVYGTVTVARGSVLFTSFNVIPTIPTLFNSSNTITLDPFSIQYAVTRESSVTIQILNTNIPPAVLTTVIAGAIREPGILNTDVWDGRDINGNFLPWLSGGTPYIVQAVALDIASSLTTPSTAQTQINYDPLRIYDLAVTPIVSGGSAVIAYQVSEPMKISLKVYQPGTVFDAAGNPSPPDSVSLVKIITGVRPPRVDIKDAWDGTDFTGTRLKEGDYKFKLVASTDTNAIDTQTGNVIFPTELADDRLIDDIPVTFGQSSNPQGDLENNSFAYPNPVPASAGSVTIQVYNPFPHAHLTLRLYSLSGRLVMTQDFGSYVAGSFQDGPTKFVWSKVNSGGRTVGRGVYYALIRVEQQEEGTTVLQTTKKVLLQ